MFSRVSRISGVKARYSRSAVRPLLSGNGTRRWEMMSLRLEMSVAVICSLSAMGKTLMMRERVSGTERVCTVE